MEEEVFFLVMSMGQRKNSVSPWGNEPQTFSKCTPLLYCWYTETLLWARSIRRFIWHKSCILLGSAMSIASCLFIDLIDFLFTNIMVSNRDTHLQNHTNTTVWHMQVYFKLNREKKNDNKSYHSRRMIHLLLHSFLFIFKLLPECCQLTQDISIWCISPDRFFDKI